MLAVRDACSSACNPQCGQPGEQRGSTEPGEPYFVACRRQLHRWRWRRGCAGVDGGGRGIKLRRAVVQSPQHRMMMTPVHADVGDRLTARVESERSLTRVDVGVAGVDVGDREPFGDAGFGVGGFGWCGVCWLCEPEGAETDRCQCGDDGWNGSCVVCHDCHLTP